MATQAHDTLSRAQIPQPTVAREAGGANQGPVGVKRNAVHFARMALLQQQLFPDFHVPQAPRSVVGRRP